MQIEIPSNPETIKFNLGGGYSAKGQPCAAAKISETLVYFVDTARDLYYYFQCPLSVEHIRYAYLNNRGVHVNVTDFAAEDALREILTNLANS